MRSSKNEVRFGQSYYVTLSSSNVHRIQGKHTGNLITFIQLVFDVSTQLPYNWFACHNRFIFVLSCHDAVIAFCTIFPWFLEIQLLIQYKICSAFCVALSIMRTQFLSKTGLNPVHYFDSCLYLRITRERVILLCQNSTIQKWTTKSEHHAERIHRHKIGYITTLRQNLLYLLERTNPLTSLFRSDIWSSDKSTISEWHMLAFTESNRFDC